MHLLQLLELVPTLSVELGRTSSASRSFGQMDLFPDILTETETTLGLVFKPEELVDWTSHSEAWVYE